LFRLFSGTQIDHVYPERLQLISPINTMYLYELRRQVAFHEFDVLTAKSLAVRLSLAIRYQPDRRACCIKRSAPTILIGSSSPRPSRSCASS